MRGILTDPREGLTLIPEVEIKEIKYNKETRQYLITFTTKRHSILVDRIKYLAAEEWEEEMNKKRLRIFNSTSKR